LIEMLGLCIKHLILAVRLLANMVAGHLVLLGIMGLITAAASASTGTWMTVTVISIVSATLFSVLELFVAFLQAYIFTFLSALFIGAAVHHH
jgi:F-type H+-transporting ATPase subunit a